MTKLPHPIDTMVVERHHVRMTQSRQNATEPDLDLQELLDQLQMTEEEVAARLRVHLRTVQRWVRREAKPRGPAYEALLRLRQGRGEMDSGRKDLRFGICFEFMDTSLPALCFYQTNTFPERNFPRVTPLPIPWDDRSLIALQNGVIDVVIYNHYCAMEYVKQTGAGFVYSTDRYKSGSFYLATRSPRNAVSNSPVASREAVEMLLKPETIAIIPPADMRHSVRVLLREFCLRFSRSSDDLAEIEKRWLTLPPGLGLTVFLNKGALAERDLVFVGGQDQLAALQSRAGSEINIVTADQLWDQLQISFPPSLAENCLVARDAFVGQWLQDLAGAIQRSKQRIAEDPVLREAAVVELARLQQLFNTRFTTENFKEVLGDLGKLHGEFQKTQKLSAELREWFPEQAA